MALRFIFFVGLIVGNLKTLEAAPFKEQHLEDDHIRVTLISSCDNKGNTQIVPYKRGKCFNVDVATTLLKIKTDPAYLSLTFFENSDCKDGRTFEFTDQANSGTIPEFTPASFTINRR